MAKTFVDTSSDFKRWQLKLILETCDAIYKQSTNLREENKHLFEKYVTSPLNRTIDSVPNNLIFLSHLLCAVRCGDIAPKAVQEWFRKGMTRYLVEETIRRRGARSLNGVEERLGDIQKALGIDAKTYIDDPLEEFDKAYADYLKKMKEASRTTFNPYVAAFREVESIKDSAEHSNTNVQSSGEQVNTVIPGLEVPKIRVMLYDPATFKTPKETERVCAIMKEASSEQIEVILRFAKILEYTISQSASDILEYPGLLHFKSDQRSLSDMFFAEMSENAQTATFLQAFAHRQNSVRREAAEADSTTFFEPFSEDAADKTLAHYFDQFMIETTKRKQNEVVASYTQQENSAIGLKFWESDTVEEAAGLLMVEVKHRGKKVYGQIVRAVQKPRMPLVKEKIEMIITGICKDVKLFEDKGILEWLPSRRNLYRTLAAHKREVPDLAFWIRLFPTYRSYLEHQFDE